VSSCSLLPPCFSCARLRGVVPDAGWTCDAFEDGIPTEVLASVNPHRTPIDGDGGLTYLPRTKPTEDEGQQKLPPVSEAQRRAMWAAASGHETSGILASVGREFASADPGGRLPAHARDMTRGGWQKIMSGLTELAKFFSEERQEPEHKGEDGSIRPPPLRVVTNIETSQGHILDPKNAEDDAAWDSWERKGRAASVAFTTSDGRVLLLRRAHDEENWPDTWSFPGGKADEGEDDEACARREAVEECGSDCTFDGMAELERTRTPNDFEHVTYVVPVGKEFEPRLSAEHSEHRWVPATDLPEPVHPGVKAAIDRVISRDELGERERVAANPHVRARADKPKGIFLLPDDEKYPVKVEKDGSWKYDRGLLLAAAREARMHGHEDLAKRADAIREREFPETARDIDGWASDDWSPEARAAAAEARKKGAHLHATATHEKGAGHGKFSVQAGSHAELEKHLGNLHEHAKKSGDNYRVHVENKATGELHHAHVSPQGVHQRSYNEKSFDVAQDIAVDWDAVAQHVERFLAYDKSARTLDSDGRMHVDEANICQGKVDEYYGEEINGAMGDEPGWVPLDPKRRYKLWRDPKELAKPETVKSANGIPVLSDHVATSARDHKFTETIGSTGSEARFEHPFIKNALVFWPQKAIDDIGDGSKAQLSPGYRYRVDMAPGTTPEGEPYDGRMKDIRFNHLAQVPQGRQGRQVVVPDADPDWRAWATLERAILDMGKAA
jgi:8-oxo-dGTP pyrophosphatase MutT (NUDIX family)